MAAAMLLEQELSSTYRCVWQASFDHRCYGCMYAEDHRSERHQG
jgi:hypothetical protein